MAQVTSITVEVAINATVPSNTLNRSWRSQIVRTILSFSNKDGKLSWTTLQNILHHDLQTI